MQSKKKGMNEYNADLSIFFHNYYGNDSEWLRFFSKKISVSYNLFYNGVLNSYYRINGFEDSSVAEIASTKAKVSFFSTSPNIGKDIGGKLVLMDAYLRLQQRTEFIMLLHDKKSLYHHNNEQWTRQLFRIAEPDIIDKMIRIFRKEPTVGIIASANAIQSEANNLRHSADYLSSEKIKVLLANYGISPTQTMYVAGTMFCVRSSLFEEFFQLHLPLDIRCTLESGNVMDQTGPTNTHSWERLLCWLVTSKGFQIKGV